MTARLNSLLPGITAARSLAVFVYAGVEDVAELNDGQLQILQDIERAYGALLQASTRHDAGAFARCSYCGRYSAVARTLVRDTFPCDCGKDSGWSGSFESPSDDARWSVGHLLGGGR